MEVVTYRTWTTQLITFFFLNNLLIIIFWESEFQKPKQNNGKERE